MAATAVSRVLLNFTPGREARAAIKFWLDCLQVVVVVATIVTAFITFRSYSDAAAQQLAAAKRELEKPYEEKKLALYLDAARVLAHLAATPNIDREKTEARFWELYWGELAFVESQTKDEGLPVDKPLPVTIAQVHPSVEKLMVEFCNKYFSPEKCSTAGSTLNNKAPTTGADISDRTPVEQAAINMAHHASEEIRYKAQNVSR